MVWTPERVEHWQRTSEHPAVAVWAAAQTATFLRSIQDHRLYAAYHLISLRGLRRGEAAGLRWCDVDLDGKTATISQQLQQYDGRLTVCPPKTPHSIRTIALDHTTAAALRAHRDRQRAETASFGPGYWATGYVFTNLNGHPMAPTGSAAPSRSSPPTPGRRRYGCTTCGTARPRSPWPRAWTCAPCKTSSATPASC